MVLLVLFMAYDTGLLPTATPTIDLGALNWLRLVMPLGAMLPSHSASSPEPHTVD
jgi:hypothetical protein